MQQQDDDERAGPDASVLRALRAHLASPSVESWVAEVVATRETESQAPDLAAEVAAAEARVEKVTDALARIGYSEPLARRLRNEESSSSTSVLSSPAPHPFNGQGCLSLRPLSARPRVMRRAPEPGPPRRRAQPAPTTAEAAVQLETSVTRLAA